MNLYILRQDTNNDYDTYDACVVCAENPEEAIKISPSSNEWGYKYTSWAFKIEEVKCQLIGIADPSIEKGIVLASFNAG